MNYFRMLGLAAALMAFFAVGTASAAVIENVKGTPLGAGTSITAESEGHTELHPPFGSISCSRSHVGGQIITSGGAGVDAEATVESLSFSECGATISPIKIKSGESSDYGKLRIASKGNGNDGTLYGTNQEVTVAHLGLHCIFKTNNTKLGTVTGSGTTGSNATWHIEATLPRTSGSSGAFCGSTAQWTGSYKFITPNPLYVT